MKYKVYLFIIILISVLLTSCYISNGESSDSSETVENYNVTTNNVLFEFKSCTRYESNIYNNDYYILDVSLKNKTDVTLNIDKDIFTFDDSDVYLISGIDRFFTKIDNLTSCDTQILLQASKGLDITQVQLEIDFGITSMGKKFKLGKINQKEEEKTFESFLFDKLGVVKKEHYSIVLDVIYKENFGLVYDATYSYLEETSEDIYLLMTSKGNYSFSLDDNMVLNVMHFYESTVYDVYINGERNPLYLSTSKIISEYNKGSWQNIIRAFVDTYYIEASCSDFGYGRVTESENSMGISFTAKGKNAYGMTLTKNGVLYLTYNTDTSEFEISYFKIGNEILSDKRITVSYITNCSQSIDNKKIQKFTRLSIPTQGLFKEGYTFIGWVEKGENELFDFNTVVKDNIILEAKWEKNVSSECNLIIDELTTIVDENKINLTYSPKFELPVPSKNKYIFKYWYCIVDGNEIVLTDSYGKSIIKYPYEYGVDIYAKFEYSPNYGLKEVEYVFDEDKNGYYITSFKGTNDIIFDSYYNNYPVIGIKRNSYTDNLLNAKYITSITFPETMKYVEDDFIHYSVHVNNSLYIYFADPDSIIELGYSQQIKSLNKILIGENCRVINRMFVKNGNIEFSEKNKFFIIEDDCLYSYDYSILYFVINCEGDELYINQAVTDIKDYALSKCLNLRKIHLPSNLMKVGCYSFYISSTAITDYYFYGLNQIEIYGAYDYIIASFGNTILHVKEDGYNPLNFQNVEIIVDIY